MDLIQPPVATTCFGVAASMRAVLLGGGARTNRSAVTNSHILIHQGFGRLRGREIQRMNARLQEIMAAVTETTDTGPAPFHTSGQRPILTTTDPAKHVPYTTSQPASEGSGTHLGARETPPKPRLRGVSHQYAAVVAAVAGAALVAAAPTPVARMALGVYVLAVVGLFAMSALYHRVTWSPTARKRVRCLDHGMIFVLIAGTATPFAVLMLPFPVGSAVLAVAWSAALGGLGLQVAWGAAPKWVTALVCVALGWAALAVLPTLWSTLGPWTVTLLVGGGAVYTLGAVVYALRRPDPAPTVFGYHEVFHALVILAAALHFVAVARWLLPQG